MRGRISLPILVLIGLTAIMGMISIFSLVKAVSWINKPFAGFLVYEPPYVGSISLREWPGRQAGLQYLERVVSVDGKPVSNPFDVKTLRPGWYRLRDPDSG